MPKRKKEDVSNKNSRLIDLEQEMRLNGVSRDEKTNEPILKQSQYLVVLIDIYKLLTDIPY